MKNKGFSFLSSCLGIFVVIFLIIWLWVHKKEDILLGAEYTFQVLDLDPKQMVSDFQLGVATSTTFIGQQWLVVSEKITVYGDTVVVTRRQEETTEEVPSSSVIPWDSATVARDLQERGLWSSGYERQLSYIQRFKELAREEQARTGIPASITLGQALIESKAGRSKLAMATLNHFGIKCRRTGKGCDDWAPRQYAVDCYQAHDDHHCDHFCVYLSIEDGYKAHTVVLLNPRYKRIFNYPVSVELVELDQKWYGVERVPYYAACAAMIKSGGYATSATYASDLTSVISRTQIWRLDF